MAYFRPSQERPKAPKRFLTSREVEDLAAAGTVEIVQVDGLVITDAARETAHDLGLRIKKPQEQSENGPSTRNPASEIPQHIKSGATPKSVVSAAAGASTAALPSLGAPAADPLVRAIVQAVRSNRPKLATIAERD